MVSLWQLFAVEFNDIIYINGVLLKGSQSHVKPARTILSNLFKVISTYFKRPLRKKEIEIIINGESINTKTNKRGAFSIEVPNSKLESLSIIYKGKDLMENYPYNYYYIQPEKKLEVISDIDDTIYLSHTASIIKRIKTLLFKRPKKRKAIVFSNELLINLNKEGVRINYLSKSESNLFHLIQAIIDFQNLASGPLFLTPHLRFSALLNTKKGKDYKFNWLDYIFQKSYDKKFILLGDDSQKDMEIYKLIAEKYPERIVKIFIRQTGFNQTERQKNLWLKLKNTKVDCMYFNDEDEVDKVENLLRAV